MTKFAEPGIDTSAKVNTKEIGLDESNILQHIKEVWRIIEFDKLRYKNITYKFAIGKPTEIPFDEFYLERDIIILFSTQRELNIEKLSDALDWIFTVGL